MVTLGIATSQLIVWSSNSTRLPVQPNSSRNATLQPSTMSSISTNHRTIASGGGRNASRHNTQHGLDPDIEAGLGESLIHSSAISSSSTLPQQFMTTIGGNEVDITSGHDLLTNTTSFVSQQTIQSGLDTRLPLSISSIFEASTAQNVMINGALGPLMPTMTNQSTTTELFTSSLAQALNYTTNTRHTSSSNSTHNTPGSAIPNSGTTKTQKVLIVVI